LLRERQVRKSRAERRAREVRVDAHRQRHENPIIVVTTCLKVIVHAHIRHQMATDRTTFCKEEAA